MAVIEVDVGKQCCGIPFWNVKAEEGCLPTRVSVDTTRSGMGTSFGAMAACVCEPLSETARCNLQALSQERSR